MTPEQGQTQGEYTDKERKIFDRGRAEGFRNGIEYSEALRVFNINSRDVLDRLLEVYPYSVETISLEEIREKTRSRIRMIKEDWRKVVELSKKYEMPLDRKKLASPFRRYRELMIEIEKIEERGKKT